MGYDPVLNKWIQKADFPGTTRYYSTAFSIDNKGFVGLGMVDGVYFNDFWVYDEPTNKWSQIEDCGIATIGSVGFSINKKVM